MTDPGAWDVALAGALAGPATEAAEALLGCTIVSDRDGTRVAVRLVEVEAYTPDDPASHTFRGRTPRNAAMFGAPGDLYVYRSHGIHLCANVVCGPVGHGAAVLLRGGVVVAGRETAVARRGGRDGDDWLAAGPGRLTQALGLRFDDDGRGLLGEGLVRLAGQGVPTGPVRRGPRVGVSSAADVARRFWLAGSPGVSAYRRSPWAPRPDDRS